jgi:hypothetical protein
MPLWGIFLASCGMDLIAYAVILSERIMAKVAETCIDYYWTIE